MPIFRVICDMGQETARAGQLDGNDSLVADGDEFHIAAVSLKGRTHRLQGGLDFLFDHDNSSVENLNKIVRITRARGQA
jgi:hypothetical protein